MDASPPVAALHDPREPSSPVDAGASGATLRGFDVHLLFSLSLFLLSFGEGEREEQTKEG
jgi:hypothetical protein